ncbi:MAG: hypothetical protein CL583_14610 [Alteromonadaceae bacterium]|nr:hypothetical protein [Alteromonadaceae bacterium]|tara:strand:+ start:5209 stop:5739 length:531 start_codon:yes stop_codon:yes gene_type:complete
MTPNIRRKEGLNLKFSREWCKLKPEVTEAILKAQVAFPVKVGEIAQSLGLIVKRSTLSAGISGEIRSADSGYVIRVNRHDVKARQRFTVAHEISHYLLHRDLIGDGIVDDILYRSSLSDAREAEANRLAADIVMPWRLIDEFLRAHQDLHIEQRIEKLAGAADVSTTAIKIRLGRT